MRSYKALISILLLISLASCSGEKKSEAAQASRVAQSSTVALPSDALSLEQAQASETRFLMGVTCTISLYENANESVYTECFDRISQIEDLISANKPDSEVSEINRQAGLSAVKVGQDLMTVLSKALYYAKISDGAFDPTVGPLVRLWGIGTDNPRVPTRQEIDSALALIGYKDVAIDEAEMTVYLKRKGMALDLGSVTKGYVADEVSKILKKRGIPRAMIDLGGNILAVGQKANGADWIIGIQDPEPGVPRGTIIGTIAVGPDTTVVTSGNYERYFVDSATGTLYHHIMDTKTGYPVANDLSAVIVITRNSINADGMTTTLFSLGRVRGFALAKGLKDITIAMIDKDKKVYVGSGLNTRLEIDDTRFQLAE